ncbi:pentapeptide repeat-containing protein, partial [Vibrio coralliilyticus]
MKNNYLYSLLLLLSVTVFGSCFGEYDWVNYIYIAFVIFWIFFTASITKSSFFEISSIRVIEAKLRGSNSEESHSSFFLWLLAIYIGLFGLSSQRYETSIDRLQLKETIFDTYVSSNNVSFALKMIPDIQKSLAPIEPSFHFPLRTIHSFFSQRVPQPKLVKKTKDAIEMLVLKDREVLKGVNLSGVDLSGIDLAHESNKHVSLINTDLSGALFEGGAKMRHVDFSHAKLDLSTSFDGASLIRVNLVKLDDMLEDKNIENFADNLCRAKKITTVKNAIDYALKQILLNKC